MGTFVKSTAFIAIMLLSSQVFAASAGYTVQHSNIKAVEATSTSFQLSVTTAIRANGARAGIMCGVFSANSSDQMGAEEFQLMLTALVSSTSNLDFTVDTDGGSSTYATCHVTEVTLHR